MSASALARIDAIRLADQNLFRLWTVSLDTAADLIIAGIRGDATAQLIGKTLLATAASVKRTHASGRRPYCIGCSEAFTAAMPLCIGVVLPATGRPNCIAVLPVCKTCGPTPVTVQKMVREAIEKWRPGACVLPAPMAAGSQT